MSNIFYFKEIIANSLKTLAENKRRTLLTTLGIVIGVSAVIIIMSIGAGAQGLILGQVKKIGSDLIGVLPGKSETDGPPATAMGVTITTLTYEDALALKDKNNAPYVKDVVAYDRSVGVVSWKGQRYDADIAGVSAGYIDVEGGEVASGSFFTEADDRALSRVAVLGSKAKEELFGDQDPIGQQIKIKNQSFEVIGVMAERGQVFFQDYDGFVFIPITTSQRLVTGVRHISMIRVKVDQSEHMEATVADVTQTLRIRHDINDYSGESDDFSVRNATEALAVFKTITDALRYFLAAMAALSLLVGGIGIMNIMLIRVAQRTREVGLRKAVGATNSDVRLQFLAESMVITLVGGILGIILGGLVSWLVAIIAQSMGYDWELGFSVFSVLLAVGVSMAIGLVFGLYPASKASKLNPIEALRYE